MNKKSKPDLYTVLIGADLLDDSDLSYLKFSRISSGAIPGIMELAFEQGYEILIRPCQEE